MPNFQLALQGGGARLADILVALTVIQDYQDRDEITITRISGTSAGAIAAAVFACGNKSCQRALDYLKLRGPVASENILPKLSPWTVVTKIAPRLWLGKSICDESDIKNELRLLFKFLLISDNTNFTVGTLLDESPNLQFLSFVATNMSDGKAEGRSDRAGDLVDVLFDSCAIPIAFKGANALSRPFVDGGLCENLPTQILAEDSNEESGSILAITFSDSKSDCSNLGTIEFLGRLFSAAISNSIHRARELLPSHSILSLHSDINLFDFNKAFDETVRRGDFAAIKSKSENWIRKNVDLKNSEADQKVIDYSHGNHAAESLMTRLSDWYEANHATVERVVLRDATIVRANALVNPNRDPMDNLDLVRKEYEFYPVGQDQHALHFHLGFSEQENSVLFDYEKTIRVKGPDGLNIPFQVLPTMKRRRDDDGQYTRYWGYLLLFDKPIEPLEHDEALKNGGYTVIYQTLFPDVFKTLRLGDADNYSRRVTYNGRCKQAELILLHPRSFPITSTSRYKTDADSDWVEFSAKNGAELSSDAGWIDLVPPKFEALIWEANDISTGGMLVVDLTPG